MLTTGRALQQACWRCPNVLRGCSAGARQRVPQHRCAGRISWMTVLQLGTAASRSHADHHPTLGYEEIPNLFRAKRFGVRRREPPPFATRQPTMSSILPSQSGGFATRTPKRLARNDRNDFSQPPGYRRGRSSASSNSSAGRIRGSLYSTTSRCRAMRHVSPAFARK